jgi:hypothetical protein
MRKLLLQFAQRMNNRGSAILGSWFSVIFSQATPANCQVAENLVYAGQ